MICHANTCGIMEIRIVNLDKIIWDSNRIMDSIEVNYL